MMTVLTQSPELTFAQADRSDSTASERAVEPSANVHAPAHGRDLIDGIAFALGLGVTALGLFQLFGPRPMVTITGMGESLGTLVLGGQWLLMGLLMLVGAVARMRPLATFGAEFLLITSLVATATMLVAGAEAVGLVIQIVLGIAALTYAGFARLVDRSELKRLLAVARDAAGR